MAERASVVENVQIGVQTTETLVAASKQLSAMSLKLVPKSETDEFRPEGQKDMTIVTEVAEWAEAALEGRLTYEEFGYALSMHYGAPTARAITNAALAAVAGTYGYEWTATQTILDVPVKLTVERGSAFRAHRAGSAVAKDLGYSIQRKGGGPSISGAVMAKRIEDGITLTAAPTVIAATPVQSPQVDVYLDTTAAGLGTTKLTRPSKTEWKRSGKWKDYWVLDSAQTSYVDAVELAADAMLTLTMQANTEAGAMLTRLRAGSSAFVRVQAAGAQIGVAAGGWKIGGGTTIPGNVTHLFRHDIAVKVKDVAPIEDQDGVMGGAWPCRVVYDATLGFSERFTLVNTLAAY